MLVLLFGSLALDDSCGAVLALAAVKEQARGPQVAVDRGRVAEGSPSAVLESSGEGSVDAGHLIGHLIGAGRLACVRSCWARSGANETPRRTDGSAIGP